MERSLLQNHFNDRRVCIFPVSLRKPTLRVVAKIRNKFKARPQGKRAKARAPVRNGARVPRSAYAAVRAPARR